MATLININDAFTTISILSGSNITLQSGSISPFALPASYIIFSGSVAGNTGPYYAINGSTNNIDFINNNPVLLMNAVFNALPSGSVFFRSGIYTCTGSFPGNSLAVHSNLKLIGEPGTVFQLQSGTVHKPFIYLQNINNFTIDGITFDGNGSTTTDAAQRLGLIIMNYNFTGDNINFLNSTFQNCRNGAALDLGGSNIKIHNCRFLNNGNFGSAFPSDHVHFGHASGSTISDNYFNDCSDTGLAMDSSERNVITNNVFIDCKAQGIAMANFVAGSSKNYTVSNCVFQQTKYNGTGITISDFGGIGGADDVSISNCSFVNEQTGTGSASSGISLNQTNRVLIDNCTFKIFTPTGSNDTNSMVIASGGGGRNNGLIMRGNYMLATGSTGVFGMFVNNLQNFDIYDNIFDSTGWGIFFTGAAGIPSMSGSIRGNKFLRNVIPMKNVGAVFGLSGSATIKDNVGYNPVGYITPDITPNASPFIYPNRDIVTEDVYIVGGSLISITGSGGFSYPISGPIKMEPDSSIVITYNQAPTIKRIGF